jgi:hypothetical protein
MVRTIHTLGLPQAISDTSHEEPYRKTVRRRSTASGTCKVIKQVLPLVQEAHYDSMVTSFKPVYQPTSTKDVPREGSTGRKVPHHSIASGVCKLTTVTKPTMDDAHSSYTNTRRSRRVSDESSHTPLPPVSFYKSHRPTTPVPSTNQNQGTKGKVESKTTAMLGPRRGKATGKQLDRNNNPHRSESDSDSDTELYKIDNPFYKSVPPNPKRKFDWESTGDKGKSVLAKYYKGNKGPPL